MMEEKMFIIGAGAAGLSAALELAKNGVKSILVSDMPSERAQSVMAEGGINAAVNTEADSPKLHAEETIKAGRYIADLKAVNQMTEEAPNIIETLFSEGMAFTLNEEKRPDVRAFGGQSVKRTFFAAANTGKQLMYVLIDQVRRYEAEGIIERYTGWSCLQLLHDGNQACGCVLIHSTTQEKEEPLRKSPDCIRWTEWDVWKCYRFCQKYRSCFSKSFCFRSEVCKWRIYTVSSDDCKTSWEKYADYRSSTR